MLWGVIVVMARKPLMSELRGPIPTAVQASLLAARDAESTASGSARRDAFRTTRHLLAGSRAAGISLEQLAALFQVRVNTIQSRCPDDGLVPAATFAALAYVSLDDLTTWQHAGLLPAATTDHQHRPSYPASALITALLVARS
jgi:hypothetical protein